MSPCRVTDEIVGSIRTGYTVDGAFNHDIGGAIDNRGACPEPADNVVGTGTGNPAEPVPGSEPAPVVAASSNIIGCPTCHTGSPAESLNVNPPPPSAAIDNPGAANGNANLGAVFGACASTNDCSNPVAVAVNTNDCPPPNAYVAVAPTTFGAGNVARQTLWQDD